MQKILPFLLLLVSAGAPALAQRDIGNVREIVVIAGGKVSVHVSANNPELNALALRAFAAHGRYSVTSSGYAYDIRFSLVAPTQVRVDIAKEPGNTPVASEIVSGTSARNALLRAADVAVVKTNGVGLRGFFASELLFIGERTGHREVYTSDLFLGGARQITHDRADALSPRWSPDGSRMLYTSYYRNGFPDIYQIDLGTYQRTVFANYRGTNSGARFSPNGQQVVMVLSGTGRTEIWTNSVHGGVPTRRTNIDQVKSSPCYSPDGSRIVFAMQPGPQLYEMSVGGGPLTRLTYGISKYCAEPDWSRADPNKIAFTMWEGGHYEIGVLDLASRKAKLVSHASFDGIEPCWLPDGRHLVYTARDRQTSVLCILDTETGRSVRISSPAFGLVEQASVLAR